MNLTIIHSKFKLNLVETSFTMIEENNWFNDQIFSKYTYPISRVLTDAEDAAFDFITDVFSSRAQTVFDVLFYVMDEEHEAVMEIEKIKGRKIEFQIRYGFEDFPNFEKKLAQLPLHKFDLVGESIYDHAMAKIALGYPATDYNFPRILTDKFDTESPQWEAFEGSINNYSGAEFLVNEYDAAEDLQINRNVMQPIPSLIYVLKTGFGEKGYTLAGDILDDPELKRAWLYSLSEYYSTIQEGEKQVMTLLANEYIAPHDRGYEFEIAITLTEAGRYKIAGNLFLQPGETIFMVPTAILWVNGQIRAQWINHSTMESFNLVDINIDVLPGETAEVMFEIVAADYRIIGGTRVYDAIVLDVTVSQLTKYSPNGSAEPTLVLPDEIDLTKCVPDITFGELYKAIKNWKNFGADIVGDTVYINRVKEQLGRGTVKNLSHKEVKEPEITANQGKSFVLKFTEVPSEEYEFPSVYVDRNGTKSSPYTKKEDTKEILIEGIPLPLKIFKGSFLTAHGFLDDKQKVQLILYEGLTAGMNLTQDPSQLMIPAVYTSDYQEWIDFLLKTKGYLWTFNDFDINVKNLRDKTTVFAYGKYHTVVKLAKKNLGTDDTVQTEIETYSLE